MEYLNAPGVFLEPMENILLIKRLTHRAKILAVILIFTTGAPMLARAQSSGKSTPPAPYQVKLQEPTQSASAGQTPDQPSVVVQRTVSVTFNYDFSKFPPCSAKVAKKCIQQFDVWEVSADKPIFLFTIQVPPGAMGVAQVISGSAPKKRPFFTGPHRIGVSAKMHAPDGDSDPHQCMVFVQVLPDSAMPSPVPDNPSKPK